MASAPQRTSFRAVLSAVGSLVLIGLAVLAYSHLVEARNSRFRATVDQLDSAIAARSDQAGITPRQAVLQTQEGDPAPGLLGYFDVTTGDVTVRADQATTKLEIRSGTRVNCLTLGPNPGDGAELKTDQACGGTLTVLR